MTWLKKNAALAIGAGLPLLLVVFFALATWIPKLLVAAPQYDVIYLTNYNGDNINGFSFSIQGNRASFAYRGVYHHEGNMPKMYRYIAASGALREIPLTLPPDVPKQPYNNPPLPVDERNRITALSVPEVEALNLEPGSISPDGYTFRTGGEYNGRGLMGGLFYGSSGRNAAVLAKGGNLVNISPDDGRRYYYYNNVKLIGWVIP